MKPTNVFVLTGKRGGFGAMKPMLRLLRDDPQFSLQLVVTDQHVNEKFGATISEVRQEFEIAAAVDMEQADDTPRGRSAALGTCARKMADVLAELRPEICLLYGDRGEVLATALAAITQMIPIGHLQGGDVSGSLDEPMRHAITKLAHLHFPATEESAQRILRMGEEPWRIEVVGDNHIDSIIAGEYAAKSDVFTALDLDPSKPVVVVLQHSETTEPEASYDQMVETLVAVRETGVQSVVVYPCSDAGFEGVIKAINELATGPQFRVRKNLDAPVFWGLLATAGVLVGNSSAGLIETPSFKLPAVNIGRRQEARLCAENVIHVPHSRNEIRRAIDQTMGPVFRDVASRCRQIFGDGHAGRRVVEHLRSLPPRERLLVKRMTY
jgi:UDP-N-acetylglucosamine 2-epimerase (non-hydrolysing)/GDP/UDP-N,N'-diacetylbacillosamine 2-epimerase (hydrolysing)